MDVAQVLIESRDGSGGHVRTEIESLVFQVGIVVENDIDSGLTAVGA